MARESKSDRVDARLPTAQSHDEETTPKPVPLPSPVIAYFKLWAYANNGADIFLRLVGTAGFLAAGVALPLMTLVFGAFVNDFNDWESEKPAARDGFKDSVGKNALYLVYIFIARFAASYFGSMLYNVTASRIARRIRLGYAEKVMHEPIAYFDQRSAGSISTDLTSDVNQIELGLGEKSGVVFQAASMLVASFAVALSKNWKLSLVCMTAVPWAFIVIVPLAGIDTKIETRIKAIFSDASSVVEEALGSITNITALGAVDKIVTQFRGYVNQAMRVSWIRGLVWATIVGNVFASTHSVYALCLFYGVKLVIAGEIPNGGTVLIVMFCCILASQSFGLIAPIIPDLIKAGVSARRMFSLLEQEGSSHKPEEEKAQLKELQPSSVVGSIRISNFSFAYPTRPSISVLKDISLDIPAGKLTAIVGTSGSGKSTIIALLERWYPAQRGRILLDGEDMEQFTTSSWRDVIGLVQQEPVLFNDTIAQNILNGYHGAACEGLSEDEKQRLVTEAAKNADAHDFIQQLPDGYNTRVGERGDRLSGGQKQRIALARAIVSNPKILLLDEVTSSLDPESEETVQRAIERASRNRTILQISHSLATVHHAYHIAVMDRGRIVEEGSHEGLIEIKGLYWRLFQAQRALSRAAAKGGVHRRKRAEEAEKAERASGSASPSRQHSVGDSISPQVGGSPDHCRPEVVSDTQGNTKGTAATISAEPSLLDESITRKHGIFWGLRRLVATYPNMALPLSVGLTGTIGVASTFPLTAFLFSKLITVFQFQGEPTFQQQSNFWALMFFVLAICEMVCYWSVYYLFGIASTAAGSGYRPDTLRAILKQDSAFFQVDHGHSSGALLAMLATDADSLENLVGGSLPIISYHVMNILGCAVLSIAVYWKLGLVAALVCLPLYMLAGAVRMRMDNVARDRCETFFLESARFVGEAIGSVRTVQSLGLEGSIVRKYNTKLDAAVTRSTKAALVYFILYALTESLDMLLMAFMFWYGGKLVAEGDLGVGSYFIIYMAAMFGGQAAGFAFGYFADLAKARVALNRLFYLLDSRPPINSAKGAEPPSFTTLTNVDTAIEFRDVSFCYPSRSEVPVLQKLSFHVKKGENICLVGRSGCGKSTVLSLLERFYEASSGQILIDNKALSSLDIHKFREKLALVGQETVLYLGTIRDNLLLGIKDNTSVSEEDLTAACRQANIHDFIVSLPDGYQTSCGPRGTALSGGQRQRIAIARALLRKPDILLLDEATSALDAASEVAVREALERAGQGRTTLAATHNYETMKAADRVILIEHGCVAEEGTFTELVRKKGVFLEFLKDEGAEVPSYL